LICCWKQSVTSLFPFCACFCWWRLPLTKIKSWEKPK
jgi:hypothetical protein